MPTNQESKYNTIRDYINFLASKNKRDIVIGKSNVNTNEIPASMQEARYHADFWTTVVDEFKEDITKIDFFYQEKDKQLPLSVGKQLLNILGFHVKPKTQEGEVKYDHVNPQLVRFVNTSNTLVNMITEENEWDRLNLIAHNTDTFTAPFVFLPQNLCYQVNVPLECIRGVSFKSEEFLNRDYKEKQK